MSLLFYLFNILIDLWHHKFVMADVIAVFVNEQQLQHGIQRRGQNFDKKFVFKEVYTAKRLTDEFPKKFSPNSPTPACHRRCWHK